MAGQLRVDEITDEAGTGSPSFPQGIQPNSLGTGTPGAGNFLRGDGAWEAVPPGSTPGQLEILNTQILTTSGTWPKPSGFDPDDTIIFILIGGGGTGNADGRAAVHNTNSGGGAGGGVGVFAMRYADAPATEQVIIGAGAPAVTAASDSIEFGETSTATILGQTHFHWLRTPNEGSSFDDNGVNVQTTAALSSSRIGITTTSILPDSANVRIFVSGARSLNSLGRNVGRTGDNFNRTAIGLTGGGGGVASASAILRTQVLEGIKGTFYGEGGNAGAGSNGQNGTIPGGGGGAARRFNEATTSGSGARGEIQVFVCRGRVAPSAFLPFNLSGR